MALTIARVEDLDALHEWYGVEARCVPFDHPGMLADPEHEVMTLFGATPHAERHEYFVARDADEVVGIANVGLHLLDNVTTAHVEVTVVPERRREGVGTAITQHVLDYVRGQRRSLVMAFVGSGFEARSPGDYFTEGLGATRALQNVRRELVLADLDDASLDQLLVEHVGARADAYETVTWVDRVPDDLLESAARLMGRMSTDAPLGELAWEPEAWDGERYRRKEDEAIARGRRRVASGAVPRDGSDLVAYTDIGVSTLQPEVAYQWDTIVDPPHRGSRLGLLVKIANLKAMRRHAPDAARLQTWNAASNTHMIRVNEVLGFTPAERWTTWQLEL